MSLNKYQLIGYKWFGNFFKNRTSEKLSHNLAACHMDIRADVYLSFTVLSTILGLVISLFIVAILIFLIFPILGFILEGLVLYIFLIIPFLIGLFIYIGLIQGPAFTARTRGKKINLHLPYALNFVSVMSSAGVTPTEIFKSLAKQDIYDEIKEEASYIYRDVCMLGDDIISSIKNNIKRTPSDKFGEFLQGLVVTVTSGGSLKSYFFAKANQFMLENRQDQKQLFETLGIMAESYVTAAVAGILLLFIVIPVMMIISGDTSQIIFLYIMSFTIVPLVHLGFAFAIKSMSEGV